MDNIENQRLHPGRLQMLVCAEFEMLQWLAEIPRLAHVDSDKLEDAVLRNNTDDCGSLSLVVNVDERNAPGFRFDHGTTCLIQRFVWMNGKCLDWLYSNGLLYVWAGVSQPDLCLGQFSLPFR